ncbi:MAG: MBL fold metallo-hydrolase [Gammaproteobacteria bacterium]|jgi:glyoxylase-like metal-dependent hydrolase (beta-lactamase superfamily II)|nr:MBL fold metallo-hydrolase [Gammaproteobacteria bacterium]MBT5600594.1 MBL fold metallo-hydrolase [Gammaproteobacteria bacterium]MBT6247462.1 MBL fold metallo-hydrolase [Gammaproteobacteria bacterium]
MNQLPSILEYPFASTPGPGETIEVAPGVHWLRMPLPMSLNHINLYLLEGDEGWTIVDTGIRGEETSKLWEQIFADKLADKPVDQIICTHMHPDHTGQAGFLSDYWHAPLLMSYGEYYQARVMSFMMQEGGSWHMSDFFIRAGVAMETLEAMRDSRSSFTPSADDKPLPKSYIRLSEGDRLNIGANEWQVIIGNGHSPEHVCLYCEKLRLFISGDQILPVITSNVSVHPTEPLANPLLGWLESHRKLMGLIPDDTLILPAHNEPFYGVKLRLQQLIDHHEERMQIVLDQCTTPRKAIELLPHLFNRKLEDHAIFMALGEGIAHIHCLQERGLVRKTRKGDHFLYETVT